MLRYDMDGVAEQADALDRERLAKQRGGPARLGRPDLDERTLHQALHLVGRADGDEPALVHERDARAALRLVAIGGGDEAGHLLAQELVEDAPEVTARHPIDAVSRLVQEEHLGRMDPRAGEDDLLLSSAARLT